MLEKSMLTGVPQIVSALSVRSKVFKTIVFLGSVTGFLYQMSAFLVIYFSYPTLVDVQVTTPPFVDLPSITVCNRNGLKRSLYCRLAPEKCMPFKQLVEFCESHQDVCDTGNTRGTLYPKPEMMIEEETVTQAMLQKIGHSSYPLISNCFLRDTNDSLEICNNDTFKSFIFEDIYGKLKMCHILNARWSQQTLNLPQVPVRAVLNIILDLEPEEYFRMDREVAGQVAVHSPWSILNPFTEGFTVEPKKAYILSLRESIRNLLPWPYQTNCTDYIEAWRRRGGNGPLSKEMCIEECLLNQTMDKCRCALTSNLYPHKFTFCGDKNSYCTNLVNYSHCFVKCSPACHSRHFELDIKEEKIEVGVEESLGDKTKWNRTALIMIYFKRSQVYVYTYRAKYESIEMFSFLGGYVGIWLGISLIALLDFLESLASFIMYTIDRLKHSPKVASLKSALGSRVRIHSPFSDTHSVWAHPTGTCTVQNVK